MQTDDYFRGMGTQLSIVSFIPAFALGICLLYVKLYKVYSLRCCRRRWGPRAGRDSPYQITTEDNLFINSVSRNFIREGRNETQPLLAPTAN
jgi:hypothetical protein